MEKVRQRGYVWSGEAKILTDYFSATKGEDISMVYNRTLSGLDKDVWDPHFALPTVASTLRSLERGTYMVDRYTGDMFLNFMLSEKVRTLCNMDVSNIRTEEDWERDSLGGWERWEIKMTVLTDSLYHAFKTVIWANTIALGNRRKPSNPLNWDRVVVNLSGLEGYDRNRPWIYKEHKDGMISDDIFIYVYYGRPIVPTEEVCW